MHSQIPDVDIWDGRPFYLFIGTRRADGSGEEYRWNLLPVEKIPARGTHYCRKDGHMDKAAVLAIFSNEPAYGSLNEAFESIRIYGTYGWYTAQVEHFPKEMFPRIPGAAE